MSAPTPSTSHLTAENPWPGLRSFTEADHDFFFGRDRETADIFEMVRHEQVVVLFGQSGLGKTSLLQAALFPQLKQSDFLPFFVRLNHDESAPELAEQIKAKLAEELRHANVPDAPLPNAQETLWEYFHRKDVDFWGPRNRLLTPVIVLDQFEEIFTLGLHNDHTQQKADRFVAELEALLENRVPEAVRIALAKDRSQAAAFDLERKSVKFVISLREDFLAQLDSWRERMPSLMPKRYRLLRMSGAQAIEVVQKAGAHLVTPEVALNIVEFVSSGQKHRGGNLAVERREVEPALLCLVCDELNTIRRTRHQSSITPDLLTGEREGIIRDFYQRGMEMASERTRTWIEDELLTATGFRKKSPLENALMAGLPQADFDVLRERRILNLVQLDNVVWVELMHDVLTEPARRSRAAREQRLQAQAAAEREKETTRKLKNLRVQRMFFAGLTVLALVAVVYVYNLSIKDKNDKTSAETAEKSAEVASNSLGVLLVSNLYNELANPTPNGIKIADADVTELEKLNEAGANSFIQFYYTQSLAIAAEINFQNGQITQGLAAAQLADQQIPALSKNSIAGQDLDALKSQIQYALGTGLAATGKYDAAMVNFQNAIKFVPNVGNVTLDYATKNPEITRAGLLAHLALGNLKFCQNQLKEARDNFQTVLDQAKAIYGSNLDDNAVRKTISAESASAIAYADLGLGHCTTGSAAADYFQQARQTVDSLINDHPDNLRWMKQSADVDLALGNASQALDSMEKVSKAATQNLAWKLDRAHSLGAVGLQLEQQGELDTAHKNYLEMQSEAVDVAAHEPNWLEAINLQGQAEVHLGNIARLLANTAAKATPASPADSGTTSNSNSRDTKKGGVNIASGGGSSLDPQDKWNEAHDEYAQAAALFANLISSSGKAPAYVREWVEISYLQALNYQSRNNIALAQKSCAEAQQDAAPFIGPNLADADPALQQILFSVAELYGDLYTSLAAPPTATANKTDATPSDVKNAAPTPTTPVLTDEQTKQLQQAVVEYVLALSLKNNPDLTPDDSAQISTLKLKLENCYWLLQDYADAETMFATALGNNLANARDPSLIMQRAVIEEKLVSFYIERHQLDKAVDNWKTAVNDAVWGLVRNFGDKELHTKLDDLRNEDLDQLESALDKDLSIPADKSLQWTDDLDNLKDHTSEDNLVKRIEGQWSPELRTVPLIPGRWETLGMDEMDSEKKSIAAFTDENFNADGVLGLRKLPLVFYPDA
ncbi:MAG TPA: AAA family ATPase, partial [Opitutales bacterium]|nr:AAA family ATPase [Opitutales bacterium]